jgi:hypothetical protein
MGYPNTGLSYPSSNYFRQPTGGGGYGGGNNNLAESLLLGGASTINPLIPAGFKFLGGLGDLIAGESEEDKFRKWARGERKRLMYDFDKIPEGDYMSEGDIGRELSLSRRGMQPELNKLAFGAAKYGGMSSPQTQRMTGEMVLPLMAEIEQGLRGESRRLGFQRAGQKRSLMASLVG